MFFGAATGSGVLLCWAVAPKPALFWGTHPTPLKTEISTLSTKLQTFYTINFFSDSPEGFALLLGQCAALRRQIAQITTPFLPLGMPQNGVSSLRIAHIALSLYFCTKGICFGWSQRDWMHLGALCMQLRAPVSFYTLWEGQKWGFFHLIEKIADFLHNKRFFLIAPRDLHYY